MKNKEKFAEQIKILCCQCYIKEYNAYCDGDCSGCVGRFLKWLEEEAKLEKKKFSNNELVIMKSISTNYNFIARDYNGDLYVYKSMPVKDNADSVWLDDTYCSEFCVFNSLFNSINWNDDEPVRVDDYVERKGKNEN